MESFYKQILENINLYIVVKDSENKIVYYNNNELLDIVKLNQDKKLNINYNDKVYVVDYFDLGNGFYLETYQDISLYNNEISKLKKDYLTGLFNRYAIFEELEKIHNNKFYSIVLGDIDFFKSVNDKYGHLVGDKVLKGISDIIIKNVNDLGIVGRFGGEEFIIIIPDKPVDEIFNIIENVRKEVEKTKVKVKYEDCMKEFNVSITFGISSCSNDKQIYEIIEEADKALYKGKKNGRNQTNIF